VPVALVCLAVTRTCFNINRVVYKPNILVTQPTARGPKIQIQIQNILIPKTGCARPHDRHAAHVVAVSPRRRNTLSVVAGLTCVTSIFCIFICISKGDHTFGSFVRISAGPGCLNSVFLKQIPTALAACCGLTCVCARSSRQNKNFRWTVCNKRACLLGAQYCYLPAGVARTQVARRSEMGMYVDCCDLMYATSVFVHAHDVARHDNISLCRVKALASSWNAALFCVHPQERKILQ
jgi:hypothetical protein